MGISIAQYRIVIGLFHCCKLVTSSTTLSFRLLTLNMFFLCFVVVQLLLSSGIEPNPGPSCTGLKLCHVNIRSLSRSKVKAIQCHLASIYDIITISETHLQNSVSNDVVNIPGFHDIIRKDRPEMGGGVAVYIRENISYKRLVVYEQQNLEVLWIQINTIEGKIVLGTIYRPPDKPGGPPPLQFWSDIDSVLNDIKADGFKYIFLLGDINADFNTVNGKRLRDLCIGQNLHCLIHEPTRITQASSTILDQIITNALNFVKNVCVLAPVSTNDHCTVAVDLDFKIKKDAAYNRTVWDYKKADIDGLRNAYVNMDDAYIFESNDVDEVCVRWTETVLKIAKKFIPNKVILVRPKDSPWYTAALRLLKRKMLRSFNLFKKHKRLKDWLMYRSFRDDYHTKLDKAEDEYRNNIATSLTNNRNSKRWWNTVKWFLGKGGDCSYPTLNIDNNPITDSKEKAKKFNEFFLSHSNIDTSNSSLPDPPLVPPRLTCIMATESEVSDLIKSIDPSKATGSDEISPKLLNIAGDSIVPSLTKLINLSLLTCKVPQLWKEANVLPLYKKGDHSDINNYRPVSILPCASKILERIVFKNVFNYLRDDNLITPHQSGFMPGDGTINQLTYLYNVFAEALDKKKKVQVVFCDISKAFDRCWHEGILYKLKLLGIGGNVIKWFQDYLNQRYQRVVVRGQSSEKGLIQAGVPQGSVLGPLLFLAYINDLPAGIRSNIKLFADDVTLYYDFTDCDTAKDIMNADLKYIQSWADKWLMKFSPSKTKAMALSLKRSNNINNYMTLSFNNTLIENVSSHKHLGLTLTQRLDWSQHIENVLESVSKLANVLKVLKYILDRRTLETIYFSFILPKLEYGCQVYSNCGIVLSNSLENFQLGVARTVSGARKGTSHSALYNELGWEKLSQRRDTTKYKFFSKIVHKDAPEYLFELLPDTVGSRRHLRNAKDFQPIFCRTETYRNSFLPSCISQWKSYTPREHKKSFSNPLFCYGRRETSVKVAQLRMHCSKLNAHLKDLHVVDSEACACGHNVEDTNHYLLTCPLYINERNKFLLKLHNLGVNNVDGNAIIHGSMSNDSETNKAIFDSLHEYIEETDRL